MILDCTQHETDERPTFNQLRAQMSEYLKMAEEGRLKAEEEEEVEGGRLVTTDEGEEGERGAVKGKEEVERVVKREEEAGRESVASESEGVRGEGDGAGNVLRPNGVVKPPLASPPTSPAHQPHPSPKRTNGTASITAPSRPPRRGGSPSCTAYQLSGGDAGKAEKPQVLDIEQGSPRKSLTEVTPQGHLYYLLDPFVDSEHSRDHAPQLAAPHQPNHAPTTSKLGRPASPGSVQPRTGADLNSVGVSSAP